MGITEFSEYFDSHREKIIAELVRTIKILVTLTSAALKSARSEKTLKIVKKCVSTTTIGSVEFSTLSPR